MDDRLAVLQEAQFYTRELERRDDAFVAKRDLWLEIVVIGLITMELLLGLYQERQLAKDAEQQQRVLTNLEASSKATAGTLGSSKSTTEKMNEGIQTEVGSHYAVTIELTVERHSQSFSVKNIGKTAIYLCGVREALEDRHFFKSPALIIPGGKVEFDTRPMVNRTSDWSVGSSGGLPLHIFLKNENGEKYVVNAQVSAHREQESATFNIDIFSVRHADWNSEQKLLLAAIRSLMA